VEGLGGDQPAALIGTSVPGLLAGAASRWVTCPDGRTRDAGRGRPSTASSPFAGDVPLPRAGTDADGDVPDRESRETKPAGHPGSGGQGRRWWRRLGRFLHRNLLLGVVLLAAGGLATVYVLSTAPSETAELNESVLVDVEGSAADVMSVSVVLELDDAGGARAEFRMSLYCTGAGPVTAEFLPGDRVRLAYTPAGPDDPIANPPLDEAAATQGPNGELRLAGDCPDVGLAEFRVLGRYPEGTIAVPLSRGRSAFAFELVDLGTQPSTWGIVTPPEGALIEETYGEEERSLSRATWSSEDLDLTMSGTYVLPGEVARAQWLDDGLLLVLGGLAGLAVENAVRAGAARRKARPEGRQGTGA
jgi:hypothetical protein